MAMNEDDMGKAHAEDMDEDGHGDAGHNDEDDN